MNTTGADEYLSLDTPPPGTLGVKADHFLMQITTEIPQKRVHLFSRRAEHDYIIHASFEQTCCS